MNVRTDIYMYVNIFMYVYIYVCLRKCITLMSIRRQCTLACTRKNEHVERRKMEVFKIYIYEDNVNNYL